jgi:hypothetical protein
MHYNPETHFECEHCCAINIKPIDICFCCGLHCISSAEWHKRRKCLYI